MTSCDSHTSTHSTFPFCSFSDLPCPLLNKSHLLSAGPSPAPCSEFHFPPHALLPRSLHLPSSLLFPDQHPLPSRPFALYRIKVLRSLFHSHISPPIMHRGCWGGPWIGGLISAPLRCDSATPTANVPRQAFMSSANKAWQAPSRAAKHRYIWLMQMTIGISSVSVHGFLQRECCILYHMS